MKIVSVLLSVIVIAAGSFAAYRVYLMEAPVATEEGHEHGHGEEHAEDEHGHEHGDEAKHAEDIHGEDEKHAEDEHGHEHGDEEKHAEDEHGHEHGEDEKHAVDAHGHDEAQHVELDPETAAQNGIKFAAAGPITIHSSLALPGEIALNSDRVVHVVPRLTGVTVQVHKNLGDVVQSGEALAVIDSRELADAKSEYLAAIERRELAQSRYTRERELFEKKISPADDYLSAKQAQAEEEINVRSAEQKLRAVGLSEDQVSDLRAGKVDSLREYALTSPIDGTIIEKHLNTGEFVKDDSDAFVIADLGTVWAEVVVYANDLNRVQKGQKVYVRSNDLDIKAEGIVAFIGAIVGEETRTARAIVELANPDGLWRPGLFVSVLVEQEEYNAAVAVAVGAIQTLNEQKVVFVQEGGALEARPVVLGQQDAEYVEILEGLQPSESYAIENTFILKADIGKAGAAHEH